MSLKSFTDYRTISAGASTDKDIPIPANKTFIIQAISFTVQADALNAIKLIWDPDGENKTIEAAQQDKFVDLKRAGLVIEGDGTKKLRVNCDNTNNTSGAFFGISIYYEEIG